MSCSTVEKAGVPRERDRRKRLTGLTTTDNEKQNRSPVQTDKLDRIKREKHSEK